MRTRIEILLGDVTSVEKVVPACFNQRAYDAYTKAVDEVMSECDVR